MDDSLDQQYPTFSVPGISFMEDNFHMDGGGGLGKSGGRAQAVMQANLCLLACHPLLTSCCAAWFLTCYGLVPVCSLGIGDSCPRLLCNWNSIVSSCINGTKSIMSRHLCIDIIGFH